MVPHVWDDRMPHTNCSVQHNWFYTSNAMHEGKFSKDHLTWVHLEADMLKKDLPIRPQTAHVMRCGHSLWMHLTAVLLIRQTLLRHILLQSRMAVVQR